MAIKLNNNFLIIMGTSFLLLLAYHIKKEGKEVLSSLFVISNFFDNSTLFFVIIVVMRVVAGTFGGRPLKTLDGKTTRPTTDKVKGAIFNMIGPFFEGGRVLDLFSGSGSLAIEAISRGMDQAVLVEKDRRAQVIIQENIAMTKSPEQFQLLKMEANRALEQLTGQFDLVLLDPPYAKEEIVKQIQIMDSKGLLGDDIMIVCETDKSVDLPEEIASFGIWKQKIYGISKVTVYVR
ncbi:TPA: 16S rRNA (guanine(966)-N(2))-methyltransferase RsmD [Streptococcus agalactiae]|nr:16S rRNA (guanine(966)-N(2))-methyltransferase RsmD [Streptococcus agalactiae]